MTEQNEPSNRNTLLDKIRAKVSEVMQSDAARQAKASLHQFLQACKSGFEGDSSLSGYPFWLSRFTGLWRSGWQGKTLYGIAALLVILLVLPGGDGERRLKIKVDGVAVTEDEDTKARASIDWFANMNGHDINNFPPGVFEEMYAKEVRKMRADPKYSKLNEVAVEMNNWKTPGSSSRSGNGTASCPDCGGNFTVYPPGTINSAPTTCPRGGRHPPNWAMSYDGKATCPDCRQSFRVNPPGIINSSPSTCTKGGNHPVNWVFSR